MYIDFIYRETPGTLLLKLGRKQGCLSPSLFLTL